VLFDHSYMYMYLHVPAKTCTCTYMYILVDHDTWLSRSSRSLQNHVAISPRYYWLVVTLKAGCIGKYGKNWLLNPWTSSQSDGNSSKWLVWLVCGKPLLRQSANQINLLVVLQLRSRGLARAPKWRCLHVHVDRICLLLESTLGQHRFRNVTSLCSPRHLM
jgi:hypothetical protein